MKIEKAELAKKIGMVIGAVPAKTTMPVLQHILLADGYLTAGNPEMTIQVKCEGLGEDKILLPPKACKLISGLPDGEVEITRDEEFTVTIKTNSTCAKFQTMDPQTYATAGGEEGEAHTDVINAGKLKECMRNVLYAVSKDLSNRVMNSMCIQCKNGIMKFAGLDGKMVATDETEYEGEFTFLVPRSAVEHIISLDMKGDVTIYHTPNMAAFRTEDVIVETRLCDGTFFDYERFFRIDPKAKAVVDRRLLVDSLKRISPLSDAGSPIVLDFFKDSLVLRVRTALTQYAEEIVLEQGPEESITMGFDPKVLTMTAQAFYDDFLTLNIEGTKRPVVFEAGNTSMKALVMPVMIRE